MNYKFYLGKIIENGEALYSLKYLINKYEDIQNIGFGQIYLYISENIESFSRKEIKISIEKIFNCNLKNETSFQMERYFTSIIKIKEEVAHLSLLDVFMIRVCRYLNSFNKIKNLTRSFTNIPKTWDPEIKLFKLLDFFIQKKLIINNEGIKFFLEIKEKFK